MTKAPRAGQVKTRLVPPLTPAEAAHLNRCFLLDTAAAISKACSHRPLGDAMRGGFSHQEHASQSEAATAIARGIGVYTPAGAELDYADLLPQDFELLPQHGNRFDERLINAAEDLFRVGFASVCLIDSDSPTVPAENYALAAKFLAADGDRIVLGPSDDGGYYLIGLKQIHRRLFEDIDWSTERVLKQTIHRAADLKLPLELLPTGYDVDDRATLRRLCEELLDSDVRSTIDVAPATRDFLTDIVKREGRARICA